MKPAAARILAIVGVLGVSTLGIAAPSFADDPTGIEEIWSGLTDSHGNSIDDYNTLSFYDGGLTGWSQKLYGPLAEMMWGYYANVVRTQIIILDWIMALGWKDFVLGPLQSLSNIMNTIMGTLGLRSFMLLILALGVAVMLFRRRTGTAFTELIVGGMIAGLGVTLLANPMAAITGPTGAITQAQEVGMTLGTAITTGGESMEAADNEEMRNGLTQSLVDALLRTPHQIINYGAVIDGGPCEEAYNEALGNPAEGRTIVGDCDSELQRVADHPNAITLVNIWRLFPAIHSFWAFAVVIALVSLACVVFAGWYGVKLVWDLVMGIAPGSSRVGLFRSLGGLFGSLAALALSIPFVVIYMKVISNVTGSAGGPVAALFRFDLINLLLLLGTVLFIGMWWHLRRSGKSLASALGKLGKQSSAQPNQVSMASRVRSGVRDVTQIARDAHQLNRGIQDGRGGKRPEVAPQAQTVDHTSPNATQSDPQTLWSLRGEGPGDSGGRAPSGATPPRTPTPAAATPDVAPETTAPERLRKRLSSTTKKASELGVHAGLAALSGGTSTLATGGRIAQIAAKTEKVRKVQQVTRTAQATQQRVTQARSVVDSIRERKEASQPRSRRNVDLRSRLSQSQSSRGQQSSRPTSTPAPGGRPRPKATPPTSPAPTPATVSSSTSAPSSQPRPAPGGTVPPARRPSAPTRPGTGSSPAGGTGAEQLRDRLRRSRGE